jgi:hypothetical protein
MESNLPGRRLVSEDVQAADVFKRTQFGGAYDERARQEVAYNHAINPSRHSAHTDFKPAPDRSANSDYWATASDAFFYEKQEHEEELQQQGPKPKPKPKPEPEPTKLQQYKPRSTKTNKKGTSKAHQQHQSQPKVVLHKDQREEDQDQTEQVNLNPGLSGLMQTVRQVLSETVADFANFDSMPQPSAVEKIWSVFTSNNRWRVWLGLGGLILAVVFIVYWLAKP